MPHSFDFDSLDSRLLALHHVALGSKAFCDRFKIDRDRETRQEYEWWDYFGHLKSLVSATLIDAAVKIRMLQDLARHEDEEIDLKAMQTLAISGLMIGTTVSSSSAITLRESCNKIIHATDAKLVWQSEGADGSTFEYWTGNYRLCGSEVSGAAWEVLLNVPDWCTAMIRINRDFQEKIDWSHINKWDE